MASWRREPRVSATKKHKQWDGGHGRKFSFFLNNRLRQLSLAVVLRLGLGLLLLLGRHFLLQLDLHWRSLALQSQLELQSHSNVQISYPRRLSNYQVHGTNDSLAAEPAAILNWDSQLWKPSVRCWHCYSSPGSVERRKPIQPLHQHPFRLLRLWPSNQAAALDRRNWESAKLNETLSHHPQCKHLQRPDKSNNPILTI